MTFSFLISSPMINPGSLILLMSIFGSKIAAAYVIIGLLFAVLGTVISLMMAVTDLSLPSMIMLRKVMKPKLLGGIFLNVADVAFICKALSDTNRLQVVELLTNGEKCACELLEHFKITQPTLSHHMRILSECDLLKNRKDGTKVFYSLNCERLTEFRNFIGSLNCNKCK